MIYSEPNPTLFEIMQKVIAKLLAEQEKAEAEAQQEERV